MNWNVFIGPAATLFGVLIAVWVKDKAQEIAAKVFTEKILSALAVFKSEMLETLDKKFVSSTSCDFKMNFHDDRIDILTLELKELSDKVDKLRFGKEQK